MEKAADEPCSPFKILIACPSGLPPSQVSVAFSERYDRIPHPDNSLEDSISEIWDQRLQTNSSLFNGKKFRYGGFALHSEGGCPNEDSHVRLHLDDPICCQHTASPLGNGAIVETSDGKIVLLQRSNNVGEFPGHFVFPGGHPEPQELGIDSHDRVEGFADSNTINGEISQEMFDSIIREVVEEIGVPAESLSNPVFIGVSRRELNVRPAAFFFMKCNLESLEIQELYKSAQDGYESTQLYTVPLIDIENMTSKMPGCHHGGFFLYKLMLRAAKDNKLINAD
ncbi:nudix hydrolase 9 isoform X2 [Momordica charantia]|uniref:Nudix hydrolase 9 isoform X2 n=1 Tax=Momordica charantia TaxID=3673 RepID=A0A6J1CXQ6_MOMCH|nr:nudix hydrolase 9 isoform X2 [Momordica charantia]